MKNFCCPSAFRLILMKCSQCPYHEVMERAFSTLSIDDCHQPCSLSLSSSPWFRQWLKHLNLRIRRMSRMSSAPCVEVCNNHHHIDCHFMSMNADRVVSYGCSNSAVLSLFILPENSLHRTATLTYSFY